HHACEFGRRCVAWNRFNSFDCHLPSTETAIPCVEIFVPVGKHVCLSQTALAASIGHRRGGDVLARTDLVGTDTNVSRWVGAIGRNEVDIGEENVAGKVSSFQQKSWCNPAAAFSPSGYCGRSEETLSKSAGGDVEIRNTRRVFEPEFSIGRNCQLHRALDL